MFISVWATSFLVLGFLVMNKVSRYIFVSFIGTIGALMILGCSSKDTPKSSDVQIDSAVIYYDEKPQDVSVPNASIDSSQATPVIPATNDASSTLDLSVNPYYDAGYEQGQEDGYNDGIENIRGDSYDDACRYKGKKRKEYELGYEEGYDAGFDDGFADSGCDSEEEE